MGEGGRGGLESLINKSRDNAKNRKTRQNFDGGQSSTFWCMK